MHTLNLVAYYESFAPDTGDYLEFTVELIFDCNRIPYDPPNFSDYLYIIDQGDPYISVAMEPTLCGSWIYVIEEITYAKNFPWCSWCAYSNFGLFDFDLTSFMMYLGPQSGFDTGVYEISIPILIPESDVKEYIEFVVTIQYCQVEELIADPVPRSTYSLFQTEPLVVEFDDYQQVPECNYEL